MSKCSKVFLDFDGHKSKHYYDLVDKFGHEAALDNYVNHMMDSSIKFSEDAKKTPEERLKEIMRKPSKEEGKRSPTRDLEDKIKTEKFDSDNIFTKVTIAMLTKEVAARRPDISEQDRANINAEVNAMLERKVKNPIAKKETTYLRARIDSLEYRAKVGTQAGTDIANLTDSMVSLIAKQLRLENPDNRKVTSKGPTEKDKSASLVEQIDSKAMMDMLGSKFKDIIQNYNLKNTTAADIRSGMYGLAKEVIKNVNALAVRWGSDVSDLRLFTETELSSKFKPIHGRPDLFVLDPTGKVWIFELKTKNSATYDNMAKEYSGEYVDQFSNLAVNAINDASIQMSYYGVILQDAGFDVQGGSIITAEVIKHADTVDLLKKKDFIDTKIRYYILPTGIKTIDTPLYMGRVNAFIDNKAYEPNYGSDTTGTYGRIKSYGASTAEGLANLEPVLDHKEDYIKKGVNKLVINPNNGTVTYWVKDERGYNKQVTEPQSEFDLEKYKETLNKEYDNIMHRKLIIPSQVVSWFNAGKAEGKHVFKAQEVDTIVSMFQDIDSDNFTLYQAADLNKQAFQDFGNDLLIAVSKDGNDVRFYSALSVTNKKLSFDTAEDPKFSKRTSIYGKFLTDNSAKFETNDDTPYDVAANLHDLYALKLATAALVYRDKINPNAQIGALKIASLAGGRSDVSYHDMETEVNTLRTFKTLDDQFPTWLGTILDKLPLNVSTVFKFGPLELLSELFVTDTIGNNELSVNKSVNKLASNIDNIIKVYDPSKHLELEAMIAKLHENVYNSMVTLKKFEKIGTDKLVIIRGAMLALANINNTAKQTMFTGSFGDLIPLRSLTDAPDYYVKRWQVLREQYMRLAATQVNDFAAEHSALVKKITGGSARLSKAQYMRFFKDPNFESDNINWMMMDDPNSKTKNFTEDEKNYIKFFNKNIAESLEVLSKSKVAKEMIKTGNTEGIIPIILSRTSIDTSSPDAMVKSILRRLTPITKDYGDVSAEFVADRALEFKSKMNDEVTDGDKQFSERRRRRLGIEEGDAYDKAEIEHNLPVILHTLKFEAIQAEQFGTLTQVTNILLDELYHKELQDNWKTSKTVNFLLKMWSMSVQNQYADDKGFGKTLDKIRRVISTSLFGASIQQISTETFTAVIRGTTAVFQQTLLKAMGGNVRFELKDLNVATKALFDLSRGDDDYVYKAALDNGIIFTDLKEMRGNNYTRYNKAQKVQRDIIAGGNTLAHNQFRYSIFTAIAQHDGVLEAYRYDNSSGEKEYNEAYDRRNYVYDPNLNIDGAHTVPPKEGTEDYVKWKMWKARREVMEKEGFIDKKTGRMQLAYTTAERVQIHDYITHLFGSMRDDAKILWDYGTVARQLTLYKRWATVKLTNVFTKTHMSYFNSEWHINNEGDAAFEESPREGIAQTIGSLVGQIYENKSLKGGFADLNNGQKENVATAVANVTSMIFLTLIGSAYMAAYREDTKKNPLRLAIWKGAVNAYSELNTMQLMLNMNTEVFPSLSIVTGTLHTLLKSVSEVTSGEYDKAENTVSGLKSFIGGLKTVYGFGYLVDPVTFRIKPSSSVPVTTLDPTVNPTRPGF